MDHPGNSCARLAVQMRISHYDYTFLVPGIEKKSIEMCKLWHCPWTVLFIFSALRAYNDFMTWIKITRFHKEKQSPT